MQVESNSAYLASLYTRAAQTAANTDTKQASTAAPSGNQEAAVANTTKAAAVTGVTGSNLSKEVMDQLIAAAQEADTSSANTEKYDGPLPLFIGERHNLEDIASNPEYAAKRAEELGTYPDGVFFLAKDWPFPTPENPNKPAPSESEISAFLAKTGARMAEAEQIHQKRTAYYESLKAQGLPSAEIYANLLEFNANLPEDYNNTIGFSINSPNQTWSEYHNVSHDYLQNLIDQGKSATASTKSADSTKADAVTGVTRNNLSKGVMDKLLAAMQETGALDSGIEKHEGILSDIDRRYLEDIARDPALAAKEAKLIGTASRLMPAHVRLGQMTEAEVRDALKNGVFIVPPETGSTPMMAFVEQTSSSINDHYKREQAEGTAPAQIYADIMGHIANQTKFNTMHDETLNLPKGHTTQRYQAMHDYLQNLIDQGGAATSAVKSDASTETAG